MDAMFSIVYVALGPGQVTLGCRNLPSPSLGTETGVLATCTKAQLQRKWMSWDLRQCCRELEWPPRACRRGEWVWQRRSVAGVAATPVDLPLGRPVGLSDR